MNTSDIVVITTLMDLHLGNGKVSPSSCLEHLTMFLYPELENTDILVIGGDFFDTLLSINSEAGIYAAKIIDELITLAKKHKFYIRVVRGTFSHDRYQNRLFLVKDKGELTLNDLPLVRVFDKIEIETFPTFNNLSMLFCPDDQPYADMTQAVLDVIDAHKLPCVDFICSHGYFAHLLPQGIPHIPHNTLYIDRLISRVRGLVLNGHIHSSSIYKKVISVGSFERFEHRNEEPKGFYVVKYNTKKSTCEYSFVENKLATPFITVSLADYPTTEEACQGIYELVQGYRKTIPEPQNIYIRILGNSHYVSEWVKYEIPYVIVTDKNMSVNERLDDDINVSCAELPIITEDNLAIMIYQNIPNSKLSVQDIQEILDGK